MASAKWRQSTVRARLTRVEKDIGKLEEKDGLAPSDERKIKRMKELAKEHDRELEQRHEEGLNFSEREDNTALKSEEAVFDEHVDPVSDILKDKNNLRT